MLLRDGAGVTSDHPQAVPCLLLAVDVRHSRYRTLVPIAVPREDITWALLAEAAELVLDHARQECARLGLPAPKLRACTWHGGMIEPGHQAVPDVVP